MIVVALIAVVLTVWGVLQLGHATQMQQLCCPIGSSLAIGGATSSTFDGVWTYNFAIEFAASNLALTSVSFEVRTATGAPAAFDNLCVASLNGLTLGTFSGGWAATGNSSYCSLTAAHAPGKSLFATQDDLLVYIGANATDYSLVALLSGGSVSGSF